MGAKRSARLPGVVWLIVAAGILLSLFAGHQVYRNAEAKAQEQFSFAADQVTLRIEERLSAYALVLRGAAQHQRIGGEALLDTQGDLVGGEAELLLCLGLGIPIDLMAGKQRQQDARRHDQPDDSRQPRTPLRSHAYR